MVPKDVHMLVSFLNTKLRDDDMTLSQVLEVYECKETEVMQRLQQNGYWYNKEIRQIKQK